MKPVLLGIAGASAFKVGSLLDRSARGALESFADVLDSVANSGSPHETEIGTEASPETLLAGRIHKTLSAAGIEIGGPLELTVSNGNLVVAGNHPQQALIEAALAQDPSLADELSQLLHSDLRLAEQDEEFHYSQLGQESRSAILSSFAGEVRLELV